MKLAVNYSQALMDLFVRDPGMPVDYVKVPTIPFPECWPQFDKGEKRRRLLPHLAQPGIISLGRSDPGEQYNRTLVDQVLKRTNPPYLSTHVEARISFFPEFTKYHHHHEPVIHQVLIEHFQRAIAIVKENIQIPLVLENFPYYTWWQHYVTGSVPCFLVELCETANCDFLLDIAHARCSAWHLGVDIILYLKTLPLHRVREIHLAGTLERPGEGLRDTHAMIDQIDYELLEYLLRKTDPEIVTIEYGGLPDQIKNLHDEYEPISRNNAAELLEIIARVSGMIGNGSKQG